MTVNDGLDLVAGEHAERRFGRSVIVHDEVTSTQDLAKELVAGMGPGADGVVVTTHLQTGGRGTRGRRWWSPAGASLAASIIVVSDPPLARPACVTQLAALAVVRAANAGLLVRWPNDVVDARGAKVAGILAELVTCPTGVAHVIGVGVNVLEPDMAPPAPLRDGAATVRGSGGAFGDLGTFLMAYLGALEAEWRALEREGVAGLARRLNEHDGLSGHRVELARGLERRSGVFLGVDADLAPRLEPGDGTVLAWQAEHVDVISIDGIPRAGRETNGAGP